MTDSLLPLVTDDGPAQNCRNALAVLALTETDERGRHVLTAEEYAAIRRRLTQAVTQLEHRPMTAHAP